MEIKSQDAYSVSLKRTVFLPKGSPGICTVDSIYVQLRTKELSSSAGKIYGLGDIDILIQYLSQNEQEAKDGIYASDRQDVPVGKTWQALLACPFEFLVDGTIECAPLWKLETGTVEWFMVTPRVLEMNFEVLILPPTESDLVFSRSRYDGTSCVELEFPWQDNQKGAVNKLSNIKEWKKENMDADIVSAQNTENIEAETIENMENAENIATQQMKAAEEKQTQAAKAENVAGETTTKKESVAPATTTKAENVAGETTMKPQSVSPWKKESISAAANQQTTVASATVKSKTAVENANVKAETIENMEANTAVEAAEETKKQENVSAQSTKGIKTEKAAASQKKKADISSIKETASESESKTKTKSNVESAKQATKSTQAVRGGKLSFYRVQEGDDLVSVAMRTGVPLDALISRNQLAGGEIMSGMLLVIPR